MVKQQLLIPYQVNTFQVSFHHTLYRPTPSSQPMGLFCHFVSLLTGLRKKNYLADFRKIRWTGKVAHGPVKIRLDAGGNPDHVTFLGLWQG